MISCFTLLEQHLVDGLDALVGTEPSEGYKHEIAEDVLDGILAIQLFLHDILAHGIELQHSHLVVEVGTEVTLFYPTLNKTITAITHKIVLLVEELLDLRIANHLGKEQGIGFLKVAHLHVIYLEQYLHHI